MTIKTCKDFKLHSNGEQIDNQNAFFLQVQDQTVLKLFFSHLINGKTYFYYYSERRFLDRQSTATAYGLKLIRLEEASGPACDI